jgi:peroxiredoxin
VTQTTSSSLTVQDLLDQLQAERNAEWPEERLKAQAELRQSLEGNADRDGFIRVGDKVDPFVLSEADGGEVVLTELVDRGPVVLLFFRFESCPACNAALHGYQETLAGPLRQLGATLVAISPQVAELLPAIKRRHDLDFLVASDPDASLIDTFGIGFAPDEAEQGRSRQEGNDLGERLGTGRWTLPYPTTVVIGRDGVVRFVDVHPNWMVRTQAATIIDVVRSLDSAR